MSRFSKVEAEARGWQIAHEQPERREIVGGRIVIQPASYRAEKRLPNGSLINQEAESIGLLLERIAADEALRESVSAPPETVEVDEEAQPRDEDGFVIRNVLAPGGVKLSEPELATLRAGEAALPEVLEADRARAKRAVDEENARAAEPKVGPREVLSVDETQSAIDSPGGGPQGTFLVREGETLADVQARRQAESIEAEGAKTVTAPVPADEPEPEPHTTEDLAGEKSSEGDGDVADEEPQGSGDETPGHEEEGGGESA